MSQHCSSSVIFSERTMGGKIFADISAYLYEADFIMYAGTVVDTSLIVAPKFTKNKNGKRNPEMDQAKKAMNGTLE